MSPAPTQVGRYELLLPVASGGMATVYLGRAVAARGFEREVAIKITHAHLRDDENFAAELFEEAKLAARIRHPNVVPVLDVGDAPQGVYLIMEYVEGESLAGLMRAAASRSTEPTAGASTRTRSPDGASTGTRSPGGASTGTRSPGGASTPARLPVGVALRVLVDALAGLHAAHELRDDAGRPAGLVHRDFSPQNVLVGVDGVSRLADFGVAKATTRSTRTGTGLIKGKIAYMSPEQVRDAPLDRRSDVFAAGVVAWELFAGRRLHGGLGDAAVLLAITTRAAPRLRSVRADVPRALDEAIARALALDVDARWPTAAAFAEALVAACRDLAAPADASAVASCLGELLADKLAARNRRAAEARASATARSEEPAIVEVPTLAGTTAPLATLPWRAALDGAPPSPSNRAAPRVGMIATWSAASLGGAMLALLLLQVVPHTSSPPLVPGVSVASTRAAAFVVPAAAGGAVAPSAASVEARLTVQANAPLAALQIGERLVDVPEPKQQVEITVAVADLAAGVRLGARSSDGRTAVATLDGHGDTVELRFAPTVAPPRRERQAPAARAPLASMPYGASSP